MHGEAIVVCQEGQPKDKEIIPRPSQTQLDLKWEKQKSKITMNKRRIDNSDKNSKKIK